MSGKKIIQIIIFFLLSNFLVFLNLSWHIVASPSFNLFNIILAVFLWLIISNPRGNYWPYVIYTLFANDLFERSPFGLVSISMLITLFVMHWLLLNIFTNRSVIIVFLIGASSIILYRTLYIISNSLYYAFKNEGSLSWNIVTIYLKETILTAILLSLGYVISTVFIRHLHPEYVNRGHIL